MSGEHILKEVLPVTAEEKMLLAERIFERIRKTLPRGEGKFSSEWTKWSAYAARKGFARALQLAQVMKDSPALRTGPKAYYSAIFQIARNFARDLEPLSPSDLADVLGYVRWILVAEKL